MSKRSKQPDLILCELPADLINRTIQTELEAANVVLSRAAQRHAARQHPKEYPLCMPHLAAVISDPLYVGDDLKNPGNIELISRVPALDAFMLVAVNITRDDDGCYNVTSFYPVSKAKIDSRRAKDFLKVAKKA